MGRGSSGKMQIKQTSAKQKKIAVKTRSRNRTPMPRTRGNAQLSWF